MQYDKDLKLYPSIASNEFTIPNPLQSSIRTYAAPVTHTAMPGIGLFKRRLEKEADAVALAVSAVAKSYDIEPSAAKTLETKYHAEAGDWYVALGWDDTRVVVRMDSVQGSVTEIKEI